MGRHFAIAPSKKEPAVDARVFAHRLKASQSICLFSRSGSVDPNNGRPVNAGPQKLRIDIRTRE